MNPLLEKYNELYGPKEEPEVEEEKEEKEDYLYSHCRDGNYVGDTHYDVTTEDLITWNGDRWINTPPVINNSSYIGTASSDTISIATTNYDYISLNTVASTLPKPSTPMDEKEIKKFIEDEVTNQLYRHNLLDKQIEEIKDSQLKSVARLLKRVLDGHVSVKSYSEQVSYDLGGSITYYELKMEGN